MCNVDLHTQEMSHMNLKFSLLSRSLALLWHTSDISKTVNVIFYWTVKILHQTQNYLWPPIFLRIQVEIYLTGFDFCFRKLETTENVVLLYAVRTAKMSYAVRGDGILERHIMQGVGVLLS